MSLVHSFDFQSGALPLYTDSWTTVERKAKLSQVSKTGAAVRATMNATREVVPSKRSARVRYAIRDIMLVAEEAKRAGKELLRLNIGDPPMYDFTPPRHIVEAVFEAMLAGNNGY